MDNFVNGQNGQNNINAAQPQQAQYGQQPRQGQQAQYAPQGQPAPAAAQKEGVSRGELFIGTNLLSKIGVIFIIVGVIAFSAASEGYINKLVRMALVIAIGVIMLVCGEVFRRRGSVVFSNALIYGGVAELLVCSLIGRFGFHVWDGMTAQVVGLTAAAAGVILAVIHKSQALLVVTEVFSALPFFAVGGESPISAAVGVGCIMAEHAAFAIISRKNDHAVSYLTGMSLAFIQAVLVKLAFSASRYAGSGFHIAGGTDDPTKAYSSILALAFIGCTLLCYVGGLLLNAAESEGALFLWEMLGLAFSLGLDIILANILIAPELGRIRAGICDVVIAVVLGVTAVVFALYFDSRCSTSTALANVVLASLCISVPLLLEGAPAYIVFHTLSAAVLTFGVYSGRKMFMWWGYSLLAVSETVFMYALSGPSDVRIPSIIANLVLWFGIMAMFIIRKQHNSTGFKIYTCAALFNAGIMLSSLIFKELSFKLRQMSFATPARLLMCSMLCACLWMVLGFLSGRLRYLGKCGTVFSFIYYAAGFVFMMLSNVIESLSNSRNFEFDGLLIAITIIVNIISVLTVLDMTLRISARSPKFAGAVGLIVSGYSLASLTSVLGMNNAVRFTSWIISIIYMAAAAAWIFIGFRKQNALLRRFGLGLALLSSAKLFLFDFRGIDPMGKTLLFIGFGVTLLGISFGYGIAEKKFSHKEK